MKYARRREPGHWELAAIAFVASRQVDIQPFWDESAEELWIECGFDGKPPYLRVWRRLRELEKVCEKFLEAAALVIQRCRTHDLRVMAHVHFDFTEDETHAALIHDCQDGEAFAADTLANRPKAVGLDWHRLRANVACLIDWLRIAAKNDWLGTKPSGKALVAKRKFRPCGEDAANELEDTRARLGLATAFGAAAAALGLGPKEPPSQRQGR